MVRLYRTFSNLIFTVGTRCVGYLYTVSEWFNPLEPPRTFSNHFSAEKARCVEVFDVSSEWFDCTAHNTHLPYILRALLQLFQLRHRVMPQRFVQWPVPKLVPCAPTDRPPPPSPLHTPPRAHLVTRWK